MVTSGSALNKKGRNKFTTIFVTHKHGKCNSLVKRFRKRNFEALSAYHTVGLIQHVMAAILDYITIINYSHDYSAILDNIVFENKRFSTTNT